MRGSQALPFVGMTVAMLAQVSNMVVSKVAMSDGVNKYTMLFYNNALGTLILLPFPFLSLRSNSCPPLTLSTLRNLFLLALVACATQLCSYGGIDYSSPVLGTSMMNLLPAFTFTLAVISRMEKVVWKSMSSQAKIVGTVTSISGAFIVTFYKGPPILHTLSSTSLEPQSFPLHHLPSTNSNWVLGAFLFTSEAFLSSLLIIMKAFILRDYPAAMSITFYVFFFGTILWGLFNIIAARDLNLFVLRFDMGFVAVLYSALIGSALRLSLITWGVQQAGPVFVAMFKPLGIVFATALGFIFLGDMLHLGSLIGAVVIVIGFYGVMWGKSKEEEEKRKSSECGGVDNSKKIPLLRNNAQSEKV